MLEQGHVYRFHLRRGVRFHNGRVLEAKDVHDALVRLLLPELNSQSSWIMREVRGAADVTAGRTRTLSGIQVRDQHTVDIILDEPLAFFLSLLTMHEAAIIPAEEARDPERFRLHPVGAGPFRSDPPPPEWQARYRAGETGIRPGCSEPCTGQSCSGM